MLARVVLDVPDLHCDGCVVAVRQVLEAFSGVHSVRGDLPRGQLIVEYDLTSITPHAMAAQLAAIGYPVTNSHTH